MFQNIYSLGLVLTRYFASFYTNNYAKLLAKSIFIRMLNLAIIVSPLPSDAGKLNITWHSGHIFRYLTLPDILLTERYITNEWLLDIFHF